MSVDPKSKSIAQRSAFTLAELLMAVALCAIGVAILLEAHKYVRQSRVSLRALVSTTSGDRIAGIFYLSVRGPTIQVNETSIVSDDETIQVWDLEKRSCILSIPGTFDEALEYPLAISPSGKLLAYFDTKHQGGIVEVWDVDSQSRLQRWNKSVNGLIFSPDGLRIACRIENGPIEIVQVADGVVEYSLSYSGDPPAMAFSPDGHAFAAQFDKELVIWDLSTGMARVRASTLVQTPQSYTSRIVYSPDGKTIATSISVEATPSTAGATEYTLWDSMTGQRIASESRLKSFGAAGYYRDSGQTLVVFEANDDTDDESNARFLDVPSLRQRQIILIGKPLEINRRAILEEESVIFVFYDRICIMNSRGVVDTDLFENERRHLNQKLRILAYFGVGIVIPVVWVVKRARCVLHNAS